MEHASVLDLLRELLCRLPFMRRKHPVVAVIRLNGVIGALGGFRRGLTLADLEPVIERAFRLRRVKAVALAINSPGGSPVQSDLIGGRIRALADEYRVPVYAFCEDVAASGGYWLALAGDEIYAAESSVVGSIGVVSGGFGFPALLEKLGVERRLHTAGDKKAMLDPFSPEKPADVKHLKDLQSEIHDAFKEEVRSRRGNRLSAPEKELFSGAFWTGRRGVELGLVDGIGDLRGVMRERFGEKVRFRHLGRRQPWWRRLRAEMTSSRESRPDAGLADLPNGLVAAFEERMWWSRFGF